MNATSQSPMPLLAALVAMAALVWFMGTQAPTGTLPPHLQAQASPGPLKLRPAVAFYRHPNVTVALAQITPEQ